VVDFMGYRNLDRGAMPAMPVTSVDEVVIAIRRTSPIRPDPRLRWHFYASDMALQARRMGQRTVVLNAPIFHESAYFGPSPDFQESERVFRNLWQDVLPIEVPCALVE
jgi:hypothetical protein